MQSMVACPNRIHWGLMLKGFTKTTMAEHQLLWRNMSWLDHHGKFRTLRCCPALRFWEPRFPYTNPSLLVSQPHASAPQSGLMSWRTQAPKAPALLSAPTPHSSLWISDGYTDYSPEATSTFCFKTWRSWHCLTLSFCFFFFCHLAERLLCLILLR